MARRAKKAPRTETPNSSEDAITARRRISIVDLPLELLRMIFHYRREDFWRSRMEYANVCWAFRNAAVENLECKRPRVDNLDHFLTFMRQHHPLQKTVRSLTLSNLPLDAKLVHEIKQRFTNLRSLTLVDISCQPPSPYNHPQSDPESPSPVPIHWKLDELRIECKRARADGGWSLTGLMHIISLLSARKLFMWLENGMCFRDKFDPTCLATASPVQDLRFCFTQIPKKSLANVMDALSMTLAPEVLQSVAVKYDSKPTLQALSSLLERIGGNVTNLTIYAPVSWDLKKRQTWADPFDDWTLLDIRPCKKLESLCVPIYVRPKENLKPQRPLSYVAAGLLANYAAPSLRKVTIDLQDLERPTTLGNRSVLKLQEFDKVVTQARFPNLQKFELSVKVTRELGRKANYSRKSHTAALRALPSLHSGGVLKVHVMQCWES